jgi:Cu-processing system ATP-binding protein
MIHFHAATKRFARTLAVDRLTLTIGSGEVVALLGPNGSGKTTTLKMAAGLVRPDSGSVAVGDPPQQTWEPPARRALSFLPQRVAFPEALTGREVVDFYRRLRAVEPARGDAVLRVAALNGAGDRAIGTYSGGMVQRLGLAVAMLPDVEVLLLDEPTAALDPQGLQAFDAVVAARRSQGRSVFFTSHHVGKVESLADRVLVMAGGRLAAEYSRQRLREWRDAHGVMRVRLDRAATELVGEVRRLAPAASADGAELSVPGSAAERAAVLEVIRSSGAGITGLTAEDGRLEALYEEVLAGAPAEIPHA